MLSSAIHSSSMGFVRASVLLACCTVAVAFAPRSAVPRLHQAQLVSTTTHSSFGPHPMALPTATLQQSRHHLLRPAPNHLDTQPPRTNHA